MPVRPLPPSPSLEPLQAQAQGLLRDHAARLPLTAQRLREFHPQFSQATDEEIFAAALELSDAQLAIAREAGFVSWASLQRRVEQPRATDNLRLAHHDRIEDPTFRLAVRLIDTGKAAELRELLREHPGLIRQRVLFEGGNYFGSPGLLEFVAENPVRHNRMPSNIVEVARVLLEAGPEKASIDEALALVATGGVAHACKLQIPLIELLCEFGADRDRAALSAAVLDEHDAARALLRLGAKLTLPIAAALDLQAEFVALLPEASGEDRHLALAVAAQFGHAAIAKVLLEAGENPDRYNPLGGHSHGTPLHHAAGGGHLEVVRLLVEHGARLDLEDVLWHATPVGWAQHEGKAEVEAFLLQSAAGRPSAS